jgi:glucokinase
MPGRLAGLEQLDWASVLGTRVSVVNDAVAALAAEVSFGAAAGYKHAFMLTLGTGVGGAILADGKIYQGAYQKAGHLGHISLDHEGEPDITGTPGSLEDAIGNCTLEKRSGGKYNDTRALLKDVEAGDEDAHKIWDTSVRKLAVGIASLTNVLSPEIIILGGGITESDQRLFQPLEHYLSKYEWRAGGNRARLVKATFGDMAGALGAAGFAFMQNK